jgi:adenylate cyclase
MKRVLPFLLRHLAVLLALLFFILQAMHVWRVPYIDRLDAWIYDARLIASAPRTQSPHVVIVDIDEASLTAFGRWPWPRDTIAALSTRLTTQQQVAALGFDMVFSEPESPATDQAFASALQNQPVVLGYYFTSDRQGHATGMLPAPAFKRTPTDTRDFQMTNWTGYGSNLIELADAAPHAGFFNAVSDLDGVIRSAPLLAEYRGQYYESMALALYRRYLANARATSVAALPAITPLFASIDVNYRHLRGLGLGAPNQPTRLIAEIPVDESVLKLIPYRGAGGPSGGSFQYISAADVLFGKLPAGTLKGKVVLIGSSSPALSDVRVTPFDRVYPGVEVQANLVAGMIEGNVLTRPDYAVGFDVFQLALIGGVLILVLPMLTALWAVALSVGLAVLLWIVHHFLFVTASLAMPSASGFLLIISAFTLHASQGYFVEGQRRKQLTQMFGNYVSPKWVSRMASSGDDYSMQASNQVLTVMFCDMRGFTKLAGTMPPLALQALLNDVFNRLSKVIQAHDGTIDKYMGDCVMAFWGAPEPQSDHAARAVRCGVAMQEAIANYNAHRGADDVFVQMGVGIHTGLMCVGDMGSEIRRSYTVVGEAVNLAARLEGLCKTYNQGFIVSAATKEAATQYGFVGDWQPLGLAQIVGSDDPISIFTLSHTNCAT